MNAFECQYWPCDAEGTVQFKVSVSEPGVPDETYYSCEEHISHLFILLQNRAIYRKQRRVEIFVDGQPFYEMRELR